ncbi:MAG: hypothetical protein AB7O59_03610 [Pirellulales bacterium]
MATELFRDAQTLAAGLEVIRQSPRCGGTLQLIVRRPAEGQRELVDEGQLDLRKGLLGDNWLARGSRMTDDGSAHPEMQLTIMNSRAAELLAGSRQRWALAGDQMYADFDLSVEHLPPGTRLAIGSAVVQVTAESHTGCKSFALRYGKEAVKFVNSVEGKQLRLRGLNAKVITPGAIRVGDRIAKLDSGELE